MTILVSCFADRNATSSLDNHVEYCRRTNVKHRFEAISRCVDSIELRTLYKYQLLSDVLRESEEGEVVIFATENALFIRFHDFEPIMAGRDVLLTKGHFGVNTEIFVLRNNEQNRRIARGLAARCRKYYDYGAFVTEEALLEDLPTVPDWDPLNGVVPIASMWSSQHPDLHGSQVVAVSLVYTPRLYSKYGPQWRAVFARHVNACHASGEPSVLQNAAPLLIDSNEPLSVYQPGRAIAVVMLYTPNIASYARFGEASLRAYCERHGYTLYVYRDVPPDFKRDACGNWVKPFLLSKYLPHHDWVFWMDADIIAMNQTVKLEKFTEGRDRVLTADICGWAFNSGVMGFRHVETNARLLDAVLAKVYEIEDVKSTFASHGDQYIFMEVSMGQGLCPEMDSPELVSFRELNTPWYYADRNTFLCHFHGLSTELRALYMSMDCVPDGGFEAVG
ncbi:galactosyl transferase GMA12/MNN10 domain protein [Caballeronia cordobensis]|uniref:Galactosyl transferase GMA12/MNN10 domain protein n=1 Tax=Caballeronia cordobensis TaxID=1353886 RepID=A0A158HYZ4_CABCO|nr:galactosyl transferase GMA12/MNN10 domain protein [Caballeronia cordobensis]